MAGDAGREGLLGSPIQFPAAKIMLIRTEDMKRDGSGGQLRSWQGD